MGGGFTGLNNPFSITNLVDLLLVKPMDYPYMDLAALEEYVNNTSFGSDDLHPAATTHDMSFASSFRFKKPQSSFQLFSATHVCPEPACRRGFKRLEHLISHISSFHALSRPFVCHLPACNRRFSRSDDLTQHLECHADISQTP
ncbi:hypothetical protein DSO57_1037628 [Entomophthora muscae]|uniref:Uncharacterized protein n=1 Tax=Entomophthora muscae TaxID=34485 RepID=A0ACC2RDM2_9FUNG|nr:hypothetical protein DSO57_1037628 [Entomophthora muscae]